MFFRQNMFKFLQKPSIQKQEGRKYAGVIRPFFQLNNFSLKFDTICVFFRKNLKSEEFN